MEIETTFFLKIVFKAIKLPKISYHPDGAREIRKLCMHAINTCNKVILQRMRVILLVVDSTNSW